jgi:LmbE family N-acetylglucosaminyl deacetylase
MRILFIGAHPDDPDYHAGGTAKRYVDAGHAVKFISMTNGDAGHHEMRGPQLAERRRREAFLAGGAAGVEYLILNNHDGRLYPTMEVRDHLIGVIRQFNPYIIFTHRPWDYHPDHRATSILVQDASYLLTVPSISAQTPHLRRMPVICYMQDAFIRPVPFQPAVVVAIDAVIATKIQMLDAHVSQFYEWLPYNKGIEREVPEDPEDRLAWLGAIVCESASRTADSFRGVLLGLLGADRGANVEYAEAFEICEYGRPITQDDFPKLFPLD